MKEYINKMYKDGGINCANNMEFSSIQQLELKKIQNQNL